MREDRDDGGWGEREGFIHDSTYFILVQCFTQTAFEYMISMEEKMAAEFLGKGH